MGTDDRFMRVTMRLSTTEHSELERIAILRGEKPATLARRLLVDGLKAAHVEMTTPAASIDRR